MFVNGNLSEILTVSCSKKDDELQVKRDKEKEDLDRLHQYTRKYKKAVAALIRTPEKLPSQNDVELLDKIIRHNSKN